MHSWEDGGYAGQLDVSRFHAPDTGHLCRRREALASEKEGVAPLKGLPGPSASPVHVGSTTARH